MEQHVFTVPIAPPTVTSLRVVFLMLDWDAQRIEVKWRDNTGGALFSHAWTGAPATTLMVALNKANLTIKSLQRRVLEQLATDGAIAGGTISGAPD